MLMARMQLVKLALLMTSLTVGGAGCADDVVDGQGGAGGTVQTTTTAAGGTTSCSGCDHAFTILDPSSLCPDTSQTLYDNLIDCICTSCPGCASTDICGGPDPSSLLPGCLTCIDTGCGDSSAACAAD